MDVTLNKINPEFAALLRKVRSIHAVTGGADSQTKTELKKLDSFDGMRGHIVVRLNHFEEVIKLLIELNCMLTNHSSAAPGMLPASTLRRGTTCA